MIHFLITLSLVCACWAPPARAFSLYLASGGATTGDQSRAANDLVFEFKSAHPDANIELDVSTSYLRGVTETLMQNFGNRTPDVAIVGLDEWPILYKKKMLRRLDSVLSKTELADVWKSFLPESLAQRYGRDVDSRALALPFNRGMPALYVNTNLVRTLAPANSVVEWNELGRSLDVAQAANRELKSAIHLEVPLDDWVTEALLLGATGTPTISGKTSALSSPTAKLLLGKLRRLRETDELLLVASQHAAYENFIAGHAAAALFSTSAAASVLSRAKFSVRIFAPPNAGKRVINTGGGDLVLPDNPNHPLEERARKDIRVFITWFYGGKGAALWSNEASMSPLVRAAATAAASPSAPAGQGDTTRLLRNLDKWNVTSFYQLDEYCGILKVRQAAVRAFENAVTGTNMDAALSQADTFIAQLLASPQCP